MSELWNKSYEFDNAFFGNEPSSFALLCLEELNKNSATKLLELGAGHGRDSVYFASNGLSVYALDYSVVGINILNKIAKEKKLPVNTKRVDVRKEELPFENEYFDAVYSHMFLNMKFLEGELHFVISEINRVLKPGGFNFFSVRNNHDSMYKKGIEIEKGIYNLNGFEIRFFTQAEIKKLIKDHFQIMWIKEVYEEPVTLYLLATIKK